jgi:hypothetical protein
MNLLPLTTLFLPILTACTSGPIAKATLDQQVDRLCAVDGGIKVYKKIKLPPEMFNQRRQAHVPAERFMTKESDYFYTSEYSHPDKSNSKITRIHFKIYKRNEKLLLGESISYLRIGGDFIGPWQESSYTCPPKSGNVDLAGEIFELNTEEKNNVEHRIF